MTRALQTRQLAFERGTVDTDRQTFDATLCSSIRTMMPDGEEILRIDGVSWDGNGVPLLDAHNRGSVASVLGRVRNIRKSGCRIIGTLEFSSTREAQDALAKVQAGHISDVSIGYHRQEYTRIPRGRSQTVDGIRYTATGTDSLTIVTQSTIRELSLCPIGADETAKIERSDQQTMSMRSSNEMPAIHTRSREASCTRQTLGDALLMRGGGMVTSDRADRADQFVGMSAVDLCVECCRLDGNPGNRVDLGDQGIVTRALSGGTLGDILGTTVDATVREAYAELDDSTVGWVRESSAPNFKLQERWRLGQVPSMEALPRGGSVKSFGVGADSEDFRIRRFARRFEIGEEDLIADRLEAVLGVGREMARAAKRLKADLVYSLLLANSNLADGIALFDTGTRGNLGTGSLSLANLGTAVAAIQNQTQNDHKGRAITLNLPAAYLVIPPNLRIAAAGFLNGIRIGQGDDLILRSESRIGTNGAIDPVSKTQRTGTTTNWMLFSPATAAGVIEVAFLDGNSEPSVYPYDLEAGKWGIGFTVRHDIGALVVNWRGSYKSTGVT